jgi:hypothetical protein
VGIIGAPASAPAGGGPPFVDDIVAMEFRVLVAVSLKA